MLKKLKDRLLIANKELILVTIVVEEDLQIKTNIKTIYKRDIVVDRILNQEKANKD